MNRAQQDLHSSTAACLLSHCVCCYNLKCTKIDDLLSKQPLNFSNRSVSLSFCLVLNEFVSCLVYVNFEKSVLSLSTFCCDVLKLDITNFDRSLTQLVSCFLNVINKSKQYLSQMSLSLCYYSLQFNNIQSHNTLSIAIIY